MKKCDIGSARHLLLLASSAERKRNGSDKVIMFVDCYRSFGHDTGARRAEHLHQNRNVHGDSEDIRAETLHDTGEYLVLKLSAEMLQI